MELRKAILTRRSVRSFRQDNVPDDMIKQLIEAAVYAPSAGNCQPWYFYVVKDSAVKNRIWQEACQQEFLVGASVLIIVCNDRNEAAERYGERGRILYNIQNTAAAVQNILLSATDMELGSCWCGDFDEQKLKEILKMNDGRIPVALIAIGYTNFVPGSPKRRPMEEVTTYIGEYDEKEETKTEDIRKIEHCDMGGTIFRDVNLYGVEISDVNLANGKIYNCNLNDMEIYDCNLEGMKINGILMNDLLEKKI